MSPLILWLGGLKLLTTGYIADLNTFGLSRVPPHISGWLTDTVHQLLLGTHEEDLGFTGGG